MLHNLGSLNEQRIAILDALYVASQHVVCEKLHGCRRRCFLYFSRPGVGSGSEPLARLMHAPVCKEKWWLCKLKRAWVYRRALHDAVLLLTSEVAHKAEYDFCSLARKVLECS